MRVLALDTTTRAGSLALAQDGRVLLEWAGDAARSQAERFPTELVDALAEIGWTTGDIDLCAVAVGPGSFTGIRIGIATIQGLAFVHGMRVAPVSALDALAAAAHATAPDARRVGVWMDAHRREVYSALYDVTDGDERGAMVEIDAAISGVPVDIIERWTALGCPSVVCGDGAITYRSALPPGVDALAPPPLASWIARLGVAIDARGGAVSPAALQPVYVRRPDVELARERAATER